MFQKNPASEPKGRTDHQTTQHFLFPWLETGSDVIHFYSTAVWYFQIFDNKMKAQLVIKLLQII